MKPEDRKLGMARAISRRDILHGAGALTAASLIPGCGFASESQPQVGYPPARTGLRGSHMGSFEVAHQLAREGKRDWGPFEEPDIGVYDLVIVGAGLSGLAAAHFYSKSNPGARILLLDNHDDFGGHAKRNEFEVGGRTLIGYGGSQSMEQPSDYSEIVNSLLRDLGVDKSRFDTAYDRDFYRRNGLAGGVYFDRETWGVDRLVRYDLGNLGSYLPLAADGESANAAVGRMPMSEPARAELLRLLNADTDHLADIPQDRKVDYLSTITYREFLNRHHGITEDEAFAALQYLATDSSVGIETASAETALLYMFLPGAKTTGLPLWEVDEPYIHHFPDGNASLARLMVRQLVPSVAPGSTMEDIVKARFDYSKLDLEDSRVRLRLNSTVVHVENDGATDTAKGVNVSYVRAGQAYKVKAKNCVLACNHGIIPSLCPGLPEKQRMALLNQVRSPILYTTVALSNWRAWKELGIGAVVSSGAYHANAMLDFPVSLGGYEAASDPDKSIVVHMERFPHKPNLGIGRKEQLRLGRIDLLSTPFETIERNVRRQLAGTLGGGGFDPAADIEGITVNRWAHGYSWSYDWSKDPWYDDWDDERYPHVKARQPLGRITIANSDAGADAMFESAVEQAHRAVNELSN